MSLLPGRTTRSHESQLGTRCKTLTTKVNTMSNFADKAAAAAKSRGLTQTEIGKACGVTPQSVQRWFAGASLPRPHHLPKLAELLDVTIDELIDTTPELAMGPGIRGQGLQNSGTSPLRVLEALKDSSIRMDAAVAAHQRALLAAREMCAPELLNQLSWEGYFETPGSSLNNSVFRVERDGVQYTVDLRVNPPSVSDTARISRAGSPANGVTVYAWYAPRHQRLRFWIAPNNMFLTREGVDILRTIQKVEAKIRSGEIDLNQNTQDRDTYVKSILGDRTEWASLFDWVDRFDLEEAIEAAQGWEPIRSK